jgi:hypothetical protein
MEYLVTRTFGRGVGSTVASTYVGGRAFAAVKRFGYLRGLIGSGAFSGLVDTGMANLDTTPCKRPGLGAYIQGATAGAAGAVTGDLPRAIFPFGAPTDDLQGAVGILGGQGAKSLLEQVGIR